MSSKTQYDNAEVTKVCKELNITIRDLFGGSPIPPLHEDRTPPRSSDADILSMCQSLRSIGSSLQGGVIFSSTSERSIKDDHYSKPRNEKDNQKVPVNDLSVDLRMPSITRDGQQDGVSNAEVLSAAQTFQSFTATVKEGVIPNVADAPNSPKKRPREKEKDSSIPTAKRQHTSSKSSPSSKRVTEEASNGHSTKKHKSDRDEKDRSRKDKSTNKEERNSNLIVRLSVKKGEPPIPSATLRRSRPAENLISTPVRSGKSRKDTSDEKKEKEKRSRRESRRDSASDIKRLDKERDRDRDGDRRRDKESRRSKREVPKKEKTHEKQHKRSSSRKENHGYDLTPSASENEAEDVREKERRSKKERRRSETQKKSLSSRKEEKRKSRTSLSKTERDSRSSPHRDHEESEKEEPTKLRSRSVVEDDKDRRNESKRERRQNLEQVRERREKTSEKEKDRDGDQNGDKGRPNDKEERPGEKSPQDGVSHKPKSSGGLSLGLTSKPINAVMGSGAASSSQSPQVKKGDCDGRMPRVVTRADRSAINSERGRYEQRFRNEKARCVELYEKKQYDAYEESAKLALQYCFQWALAHETTLRLQDTEIKQMPSAKRLHLKREAIHFYRYMNMKFIKERIEELEKINRHQTANYFRRARSKSYLRIFALQRVWEKEQRGSDEATLRYANEALSTREKEINHNSKMEISVTTFSQLNRMAKDYANVVSIMHDIVNEKVGYEDAGLECNVQ